MDCHAALDWVTSTSTDLGVDPSRVAVAGISAGAGLAAALALFERDRDGPAICHQWLAQPLLDDLSVHAMRASAESSSDMAFQSFARASSRAWVTVSSASPAGSRADPMSIAFTTVPLALRPSAEFIAATRSGMLGSMAL